MVLICESICSAIAYFSLNYLLVASMICPSGAQAHPTVSQMTEISAYELALVAKLVDIQAQQCEREDCGLLQAIHNVTITLAMNNKEPSRIRGGARRLSAREEENENKIHTTSPKSDWTYEGILAPDGFISTNKILLEGYGYKRNGIVDRSGTDNRALVQHHANQLGAIETKYRPCPDSLRDLIPCSHVSGHLYGHCPNINRGRKLCVISTPASYARQFKWPASKDQVRGLNIPNVPLLRDQHQREWMQTSGKSNTLHFIDADPRFPDGVNKYFDDLAMMIPEIAFGKKTRLALDIGCGTGNVAAALERRQVLTLSIAGEGSIDNGVQLVLERGYPALVQSLVTHRLPYPSQAFDLLHCASSDIEWMKDGGLKLLEADRILRPGGFFIWMDPTEGANWNEMEDLTKKICWRGIAKWGRFSVWQKPDNQSCYLSRGISAPPLCDNAYSLSSSWNVPIQRCLVGFVETDYVISYPWPDRLDIPPKRLEQIPAAGIEAAKSEVYLADLNYWMYIVAFYAADFGPLRIRDIHNVLDMNAGYGGFAAAVSLTNPLQWWVLSVVPVDQPDRLTVIFDRGLLGVYHDWCESLDVHPRTFDMLHSSGFFSSLLRCTMIDIVYEMDRILRPGGFAIIRDLQNVLLQVQIVAKSLHWKAHLEDTESGPMGKDKILICQKTFWRPKVGKNDRIR